MVGVGVVGVGVVEYYQTDIYNGEAGYIVCTEHARDILCTLGDHIFGRFYLNAINIPAKRCMLLALSCLISETLNAILT